MEDQSAQPGQVIEAGRYRIFATSYGDRVLARAFKNKDPVKEGNFYIYRGRVDSKKEYLGEYEGLKAVQERIFNNPKKDYWVNCPVDFGKPEDFAYGLLKLIEPHVRLSKNFVFSGNQKKVLLEAYNIKGTWNLFITPNMLEEFLLCDGSAGFFEGLVDKAKKVFIDIPIKSS